MNSTCMTPLAADVSPIAAVATVASVPPFCR